MSITNTLFALCDTSRVHTVVAHDPQIRDTVKQVFSRMATTVTTTTRWAIAEALDRVQQSDGDHDKDDIHLICTAGQDPEKWRFVSHDS
jgi:hypothetical protein